MDPLTAIDQPAPDFTLLDLEGNSHTLSDLRGSIVIVNFWSAECPWVERADGILLEHLKSWGYAVRLLPVVSNANEELSLLAQTAAQRGLPMVLRDTNHRVADLYSAQATPHLYVIDALGILRYQGALDNVTFRHPTPTQQYLSQVVEALLAGRHPVRTQTPAYGCAIVRG